jgi:hypothetical protein
VDAATADAIEAVLDQLDACAAAERDFSLVVGAPPTVWSPSFHWLEWLDPCRVGTTTTLLAVVHGSKGPVEYQVLCFAPLQTTQQGAATSSRATLTTAR